MLLGGGAGGLEGLSLGCFDEQLPDADAEVTVDTLPLAIVAGCRRRLLSCRGGAMAALREGFVGLIDLRLQLAPLSCAELQLMTQGVVQLSVPDLLGCIEWPAVPLPGGEAEAGAGAEAEREGGGFVRVCLELRQLICEERLDAEQRLQLLQWCTARNAMPHGGLQQPISLVENDTTGAGDFTLPEAHTCAHELHLYCYSNREVLCERLLYALEHRNDGFGLE